MRLAWASHMLLSPGSQPLTRPAMVCPWGFEGLASSTPSLSTSVGLSFQLLLVWRLPVFWYPPGIHGAGPVIAYPNAYGEDINPPYLVGVKGGFFEMKQEVLGCVCKKCNQNADSWYGQSRQGEGLTEHFNCRSTEGLNRKEW